MRRLWLLFLIGGTVGGTAFVLLPTGGIWRPVLSELLSGAAAAAVYLGIRRHRPEPTKYWGLVAIGAALLAASGALRHFYIATAPAMEFPTPADAVHLLAWLFLLLGLTLLLVSRVNLERRLIADAAVVAVGLWSAAWMFVIYGNLREGASAVSMAAAAASPAGGALVLSVGLVLMATTSQATVARHLLVGSLALLFAGDTADVAARLGDGDTALASSAWALSSALLGAAMLHPSVRELSRRSADTAGSSPRQWTVLAATALLPVILLAWSVRSGPEHLSIIGSAAVLVFVLTLFRVRGLMVDVDEHARAKRALSEAERALRDANRELEEKVQQRTTELERSLFTVERANEQRRQLVSRLVTAQEQERQRIAYDIHDDSIQKMAGVALRLDLLRMYNPELREDGDFADLVGDVREAMARLRKLMFDLRPQALDTGGLGAALRVYLEERSRRDAGPAFHVVDSLEREPPEELRTMLFRIAQEALANTWKHSGADEVRVELAPRDGGLLLRIVDDGTGFAANDEAASPAGHLGLTAMRERAEMAGGWLRLRTAPGEGTRIDCWVPLTLQQEVAV